MTAPESPAGRPAEDPDPIGLFDGVLARGDVRHTVTDRAWLAAMLDVEAALARALATAGLIEAADAEAITAACATLVPDPAAIGVEAVESGLPVIALVRRLTAAVPESAAGSVHRGATSQDIVDSAAMLLSRRAADVVLADLSAAADAAASLAAAYRDTTIAGRTLLQQALPTTFGLKAAGWLLGLDAAYARLAEVGQHRLAVQLGGAAGTLASLGDHGVAVLTALADELGLAVPIAAWHTERSRVVELATALGEVSAAAGRIARDVVLLAQTEVAEVREFGDSGRGASSTLPHKRNPVAAVCTIACATQAPGLVATLLSAAAGQEQERAAGSWQAEWRPLTELLKTTGSAVAWLADCLEHLEVDADRMRANLDLTGGLILAERVTADLTPAMGRLAAHDLVTEACDVAVRDGRRLGAVLAANPRVTEHIAPGRIRALLDPETYLGSAPEFVDRALQAHQSLKHQNMKP